MHIRVHALPLIFKWFSWNLLVMLEGHTYMVPSYSRQGLSNLPTFLDSHFWKKYPKDCHRSV
jgi:hypothetical protein